jgi:translation initiation factor 2 alpha subunit (eIF-2alpha)
MSKFTLVQRDSIKSLVATLSLKRIPDNEIVKEIERQTNETVSTRYIISVREQIKKEWYNTLREDRYSYIHEFKERINEIESLQKMHHEIIESNKHNPSIQQTSLAELHRLNVTLSNYFEVAPTVVNGITLPTAPKTETETVRESESEDSIITV